MRIVIRIVLLVCRRRSRALLGLLFLRKYGLQRYLPLRHRFVDRLRGLILLILSIRNWEGN